MSPDNPSTSASELLARLLSESTDGLAERIDLACRERPGIAAELRGLYRDYERLSRELGREDSDVGTTAVCSETSGDHEVWSAFVRRLQDRGEFRARYVVEGEVARGGMGVIFRAIDRDTRRRVALKVMGDGSTRRVDEDARSAASLGRFLEEAQVTAQLDHPGIVPVHEIGVDSNGRVYFTMKLVKGEDFLRIIERIEDPNDEWSVTRGVSVLLRVCEAMSYAHAKGILHRDLKPANLMVGRYGEVYVMDWGLARVRGLADRRDLRVAPPRSESVIGTERADVRQAVDESPLLSMDGDVLGTPAYMSPEQAFGQIDRMGPASDVYAVGAVLYHLLTGQTPYVPPGARVSPRSVHAMVMQGPPSRIHDIRPEAPQELTAIAEKAMSRKIENRYASMDDLAADLRALLERRVVRAYERGLLAELRKLVARNKVAVTSIGLAMLLVAGSTAAFLVRLREERNEAQRLANENDVERRRAERATLRARRELDERRLNDLIARTEECFPITLAHREHLGTWIEEATFLRSRQQEYDGALAELVRGIDDHRDPRAGWAAELRAEAASMRGEDARQLLERAAAIDASIVRHPYITSEAFRDTEERAEATDETRFVATRLASLCDGIRALGYDRRDGISLATMERYAEMLRRVERAFESSHSQWTELVSRLADPALEPRYAGLALRPEPDLVPLGADPATGLQEFWHVPSGNRPERDPTTGTWRMERTTGLVLVLLPPGDFPMGSQSTIRGWSNFAQEAYPNERFATLRVPAIFISRYEVTKGQWRELSGLDPSAWSTDSGVADVLIDERYPVESVDADWAVRVLARFALRLPFESEWEYAARAGSPTRWWWGDDGAGWIGRENLRADDVYEAPRPVGSFPPNAFGLHDMAGNLFEICGGDYYATFAREALDVGTGGLVAVRGGSYRSDPSDARSARRRPISRDLGRSDLGIRPVRPVSPPASN